MLALAITSLAAIGATFAISIYSTELAPKARGFSVVVIGYLISCIAVYRAYVRRESAVGPDIANSERNDDSHLKMLDEAREFFAGSLTTPDTFRLIVSRIAELVPHTGISLLLLDENRDQFNVVQTSGITYEKGNRMAVQSGVVGRCLAERDVIIDHATQTAAIALKRETEVFGMLVLNFAVEHDRAPIDASLLDAIGERAAPLVLAAIARERSQENALTDVTTDLPNERAFHLVLENQVAESVRRAESRPLTILSFDIKGFDEINSHHGHAAGDRVIAFVAQSVKESLRQMDFFAKGVADEFLAIMPTASKEISHDIIARVQTSLFGRRIKISDIATVELELNFGWASFGVDGETPAALIAVARERKEQSKSSLPGSVLWFPQEVAH